MCFSMKLFALLPLHIFHLSLCCFLPSWVVVHGFLAEVPQLTLPAPCFRSRSPLLSPCSVQASLARWSSSLSSNCAGKLEAGGSAPEQARTNRSRSQKASGHGLGPGGTSGARPLRPRSPLAPPGWHTASFTPLQALGTARCLVRPQQGSAAGERQREPSFVPWCHGERAVLPPQSHRLLFSLPSRNRQRGNS